MKILYSCVGDTDPTRNCRDGGVLHILRAYHPEKAILFLSKEMTEKENKYQRYSGPIAAVDPQCEVTLIKTDLTEAQKFDSLHPVVDEFYKVIETYPNEEILVNLSSGTPQMKMILAMLSLEYVNVKAIQVDSPERGSNRNAHPLNDDATVEEILATNLDNEPEEYINRCSEPKLRFIKYRQVAQELMKLTAAYSYKDAWELANSNKDILSPEVVALIHHAYKRSSLEYTEATKEIKNFKELKPFAISNADDPDVTKLREYLWIMQVRMKQDYRQDFFVKMSPFLYELLRFYVTKVLRIPLAQLTGSNRSNKLSLELAERNFPKYYNVLKKKLPRPLRDNQNLSYYLLELFLQTRKEVPDDMKNRLKFLRQVERNIRNRQAHEIEPLTEKMVREEASNKSTENIFNDISKVFYFVLQDIYSTKKELIYDQINEKLADMLKEQQ